MAWTAAAQQPSDPEVVQRVGAGPADVAAPPHISFVDGSGTVDRDGISEPAVTNAPFEPGDRLRTAAGRVEILFPDGTALDVDQNSSIDFQGPTLLRLGAGRILLTVAGVNNPAAAPRFQIDTPAASARTDGPGEYRVAVLSARDIAETELTVLRGTASLENDRGSMVVGAGERTVARDGEMPAGDAINSARYDDFDLWTRERRDERTVSTSAQYLPQDLRVYGATFDQDGSWEYSDSYGYVWYPAVAPGWRPYYRGYWASYRHWGWTWVGFDRWAWPTHHYGHWGTSGNRWFWVPGQSWAPAHVAWAVAPGYVSWCPLGLDGRPVFALAAGEHHQAGWTTVPRHAFTALERVDRFAVAPAAVPPPTAFVVRRSAPAEAVVRVPHADIPAVGRGVATSRGGAQIARPAAIPAPAIQRATNPPAAKAATPPPPAIAVSRPAPAAPPVRTQPAPAMPRMYPPPPTPRAAPPASAVPVITPAQPAIPRPVPPVNSAEAGGARGRPAPAVAPAAPTAQAVPRTAPPAPAAPASAQPSTATPPAPAPARAVPARSPARKQ